MSRSLYTARQRRSLSDLLNLKMAAHLERRAAAFNRDRPLRLAIFAHDHIGIQINQFGLYDKAGLELLFDFLAPLHERFRSGLALDVGANIGNHALYFADIFRAVHAFEPNPDTHYLLAFNARARTNVHVHNIGLADRGGPAVLHVNPDNMGAASVRHTSAGRSVDVPIALQRLDDFAIGGEDFCFMKMDVEGFEANVLRGGSATIATHQPLIVLEQHALEFAQGESECVAILRALGYRFCWSHRAHRGNGVIGRRINSIRTLLFGRAEVVEIVTGDTVPPASYNLLIAVPPRFQRELRLAA